MKKKILIVLGGIFVIALVCIMIIYKKPKEKEFTVTFSGSGLASQTLKVNEDGTVEKINDPSREGYVFEGWYIGEEEFDFSTKITEDVTLTAKWKKIVAEDEVLVTFDTDGGDIIDEISVKKGNSIVKPKDPTKKGYTFIEWRLDGKKFDFSTKVSKNIKLVATYKEDETVEVTRYNVKFDSDGGSSIGNKSVVENEKVSKPSNPSKPNYTFVEWQLDGKTYDFSKKVTKNITLKAVWKEKSKVTVTFDSKGGNSVPSRQVYQGNSLGALPSNPSKSGFTFDGWYSGDSKYDASSIINSNITLNAKWIDNDEIAINNAKNAISSSYDITAGGQSIEETYSGCTITHSNPEVIAKITRETSDSNVTLNFNIVCGSKTATKSAKGVIKASPYKYTATANSNMQNYDLLIKSGETTISNNGMLSDTSGKYLSDITSGAAVINNSDISGNPNFLINIGDSKTFYIITKK